VGLNGTGDTLNNTPFTRQSLEAMLERLGVNVRDANLRTANVAAVMVTAHLPPFSTQGTRIDVSISALGDASSLQGGTLLVTPLIGADGEVYAVGQGPVAIAGFSAEGQAATATRGTPTVGRISNGAIIEREVVYEIASKQNLRLALRNPDFTTGRRIANAINAFLGSNSAELRDPATISLTLPANYGGNIVELLTDIEQLRVDPDMAARIVIDESSGIIVMGQDVRVSTVAIAQGNLTVTVTENAQVSQPDAPLTDGVTVFVPRTDVAVTEEDRNGIAIIENGVTLQELVDGLNALGISPRDMIAILQAIKAAGALQAEIEVM
jgi:flagellar P-ring protein precursor FlgI